MPEAAVMEFIRPQFFPHIWCPGCGHGIIMHAILSAVSEIGRRPEEVAVVSGIGCSGRMPGYINANTLHTTHGRALAFATGLKMARSDLLVIAPMGDGDCAAIGGNHFIHAARRNIGIKAVILNNNIYGMTGGQYSPTTPTGARSTTTPYGNLDQAFDISKLAVAAGASYVARTTVFHYLVMKKYLKKSFQKKGFTVVEVITMCPVQFGRKNKLGDGPAMLKMFQKNSVSIEKAKTMSEEELKGKTVIGEFVDRDVEEYAEKYNRLIESLGKVPVDKQITRRGVNWQTDLRCE